MFELNFLFEKHNGDVVEGGRKDCSHYILHAPCKWKYEANMKRETSCKTWLWHNAAENWSFDKMWCIHQYEMIRKQDSFLSWPRNIISNYPFTKYTHISQLNFFALRYAK